jgi:hypothetical protein
MHETGTDQQVAQLHDRYMMMMMLLSEQTVTFALYIINRLVFITEVESVYCTVQTESLHNMDKSRPLKVKFGKPRDEAILCH